MLKNQYKIKILILFTLLLWRGAGGEAFSQNLVPNPSFENMTQCPTNLNQIYYASPWFQPSIHNGNVTNSSSSDLFDTCSNNNGLGVPWNTFGFQYARTGVSYAGIFFVYDTANYREYLEVPLDSPLIANKKYCVEFYVSLAYPGVAVTNCGAYFSNDSLLDTSNYKAITYVTPQIENSNTNFLSDTANWMLVSGNFIASGGERFMTIGNFYTPANTNSIDLGGGGGQAYYFIDDVSVVDCTGIGINEEMEDKEIGIYPNPNNGEFTIESTKNKIQSIRINNLLGEVIKECHPELVEGQHYTINLSSQPKGIYFVQVQTDVSASSPQGNGILNEKVIIQ